jgi:hypothetical protein
MLISEVSSVVENDFGSNVEHEDRVSAKQQLKQALLTKLEVMQDDPLRFYRPHDKQDAFHRAGDYKHRAEFAATDLVNLKWALPKMLPLFVALVVGIKKATWLAILASHSVL